MILEHSNCYLSKDGMHASYVLKTIESGDEDVSIHDTIVMTAKITGCYFHLVT